MKCLDCGCENVTGGVACIGCGALLQLPDGSPPSTPAAAPVHSWPEDDGVYYAPSNANTVFVLGILSVTLCAFFGPIAWYMGSSELRRIDAGHVDPIQRGYASAGRILGVVSTTLFGLAVLFMILVGLS